MYAQIGSISLENQLGFDTFADEKGANIVEHALIDAKPRLQKVGSKLDKITLAVNLHIGFCTPEDVIFEFEKYVKNSTPVPITLGTGKFLGNFILTDIKKTLVQSNRSGKIIECKIEIPALEWVGKTAKPKPTSVTSSNPPTVSVVSVPMPVAGAIAGAYKEADNLTREVEENLKVAGANPAKKRSKFKDTLFKIQRIDDNLKNMYDTTANVFILINEAAQLRNKVTATRNALTNLKSFCEIEDVDGAKQANRDFQGAMKQTGVVTAPFTKTYVLRRSC